jgi:pilus assembly protein CpaB
MGPARVLILAVALTSAVGAAIVVRGMAQGQAQPAAATADAPVVVERPMTEVLIAKRDLPAGTTLVEADMGWQSWPQESINEAFITKATTFAAPEAAGRVAKVAAGAAEAAKNAVSGPAGPMAALIGAVVREPVLAGEPMTQRKVVRAGTAGILAISLEPGLRAMAVPLSAESAAGGFILPGDHVDVVQSRETDAPGALGGKRFISGTILRNVKVLAIDQTTGSEEAAVVGATATLQVSSKQAEALVLAKAQGVLTLVLRSYADAGGPAQTVATNDADADADAGADSTFNSAVVRVYRDGQEPALVTVNR